MLAITTITEYNEAQINWNRAILEAKDAISKNDKIQFELTENRAAALHQETILFEKAHIDEILASAFH